MKRTLLIYIALIATAIIALFVKYATIKTISPFYYGTDKEIVTIINNFGLKNYAISLAERLLRVYTNYGG